jgi:hypothetical protein
MATKPRQTRTVKPRTAKGPQPPAVPEPTNRKSATSRVNLKFDDTARTSFEAERYEKFDLYAEQAKSGEIRPHFLASMIRAGLFHEQPEMTTNEAAKLVDDLGADEARALVGKAL